jgi:hypothetical protein
MAIISFIWPKGFHNPAAGSPSSKRLNLSRTLILSGPILLMLVLLPLVGGSALHSAIRCGVLSKMNLAYITLNRTRALMLLRCELLSSLPSSREQTKAQLRYEFMVDLGIEISLSMTPVPAMKVKLVAHGNPLLLRNHAPNLILPSRSSGDHRPTPHIRRHSGNCRIHDSSQQRHRIHTLLRTGRSPTCLFL